MMSKVNLVFLKSKEIGINSKLNDFIINNENMKRPCFLLICLGDYESKIKLKENYYNFCSYSDACLFAYKIEKRFSINVNIINFEPIMNEIVTFNNSHQKTIGFNHNKVEELLFSYIENLKSVLNLNS